MKNNLILFIAILLLSCGSSQTSTQNISQDKPKITNSEAAITPKIKDEPKQEVVVKPQVKDDYFIALTDPKDVAKGEELFTAKVCSACHLTDGGGLIGPNLTDRYTISGCDYESIFTVIAKGGRPGKGMIAWEQTLSKKEIQQLTSYILTLQGTTPEEPKRPEGEPCNE